MIFKTQYFDYVEGNSLWHFYRFDSKQKHFNCSSYQKKSCFQTALKSTASVRPACLGTQKHSPDSLAAFGAQQGQLPDRCWEEMRSFPSYNKLY